MVTAGVLPQCIFQIIFLTEAASKKLKIGNQEIILKKTTKKNMLSAGTREGLLIQALKKMNIQPLRED